MLHKPLKTVVFSLALVFIVAGFAFAGQAGKSMQTTQSSQSSSGTTTQGSSGTTGMSGTSGSMGMSQDAISATVQEVDQEEGKLHLRTMDGETVELKVPETTLSTLQTGDRVEVTIRKQQMSGGSQSGSSGRTQ